MTFWGTIGRIFLVPIAFIIAMTVSLFVLVTLGSEKFVHWTRNFDDEFAMAPDIITMMFDFHLLLSGLTLIPAVFLVIVGEVARIRSSVYYIVGGGAALAVVPFLVKIGMGQALDMPPTVVWQVLATSGFAGGLVYWMIAGRTA